MMKPGKKIRSTESSQNIYTNIDETILGVEMALNGHYQNALQPAGNTTRPDHLENPDKIGLRFHFHGIEEVK